jgi:dTMP kinase
MFIVFEGVDGCGKSTHAKLLAEWLKEAGKSVLLTAEPTQGKIGHVIRQILSGAQEVDPRTLALLFTADRCEHVKEIRAAQEEGKIVISDRYYYSTVAYQSAQGLGREWLLEINKFDLKPDLVLLLDIAPAAAEARAASGEIFENKEFLGKFRTLKIIDSSRPKEAVQADIRALVERILK